MAGSAGFISICMKLAGSIGKVLAGAWGVVALSGLAAGVFTGAEAAWAGAAAGAACIGRKGNRLWGARGADAAGTDVGAGTWTGAVGNPGNPENRLADGCWAGTAAPDQGVWAGTTLVEGAGIAMGKASP